MTEIACIRTCVHTLPIGKSYETYEWEGDARAAVLIDDSCYDIKALPWKLIRSGEENMIGMPYYYRADGWLFLNAYIMRGWEFLCRIGRGLQARIILTFHVWGMGDTPPYEEFRWGNLLRKNPYKW